MILTGKEIEKRLGGDIIIEPYHPQQLNPNSYNLCLHSQLLVYTDELLDSAKKNPTREITIPDDGMVLEPGQLYLGRTAEYTETRGLVPMILGRSSVGRLGISVHLTSGFGDIGFCGCWTLQLTCIKKVRIYPNMKICQIFYHDILGEYENYSSEKYQRSSRIMSSKLYEELTPNPDCRSGNS